MLDVNTQVSYHDVQEWWLFFNRFVNALYHDWTTIGLLVSFLNPLVLLLHCHLLDWVVYPCIDTSTIV
jgi:hypothetical protein